ncbi:MAG: hypothetical protein ACFB0E_02985 [Leptolyngbyaceae cyanobacterium]
MDALTLRPIGQLLHVYETLLSKDSLPSTDRCCHAEVRRQPVPEIWWNKHYRDGDEKSAILTTFKRILGDAAG